MKNSYEHTILTFFIAIISITIAPNAAPWNIFSKNFSNYKECLTYVNSNTNDKNLISMSSWYGCQTIYTKNKTDDPKDSKFGQCLIDYLRDMTTQETKIEYVMKCGDKANYPRSMTLNLVDRFNGNWDRQVQQMQEDVRRDIEAKHGINPSTLRHAPHTCIQIGNILDCR